MAWTRIAFNGGEKMFREWIRRTNISCALQKSVTYEKGVRKKSIAERKPSVLLRASHKLSKGIKQTWEHLDKLKTKELSGLCAKHCVWGGIQPWTHHAHGAPISCPDVFLEHGQGILSVVEKMDSVGTHKSHRLTARARIERFSPKHTQVS